MTAFLFDLDGTVMDTPSVIVGSLRSMLEGRDGISETLLRSQIGRPLDAIVETLLPDVDHEGAERARQRFRQHFAEATRHDAQRLVIAEVMEAVADVRANGSRTAIVTSKITASAEELLRAGGIRQSFDAVIGHDQASRGKPSPELALIAAAQLRELPEHCVVIGDSVDDMAMGADAGMTTVGVLWGVAARRDLEQAGAMVTVTNPNELNGVLRRSTTRGAA